MMSRQPGKGRWTTHGFGATFGGVAAGLGLLLGAGIAPAVNGANDPAARFHGAPTYDFGVTNVKWEAGTKDYSFVTFDLSWSFSWRLKWTEPAKTSVTGKDIEVENWDAAWVFVKFLPEKDSKAAKERNHWQHATLAKGPSHHVMPSGATNTVKVSDDPAGSGAGGSRGMGIFIYRDAIGHGANNWKGIKLRWQHGMDKVDPAKAAVKVHTIAMVYVPEGPFKVGTGLPTGISRFNDGPDMPFVRHDWESSIQLPDGSWTTEDWGSLTDGSWRGGPSIRFLVDEEWNRPVQEGTRARRFGIVAGQLWNTQTFAEQFFGVGGSCTAGTTLNDDWPTGYDPFYCMKYDVTQGQYTDYLNSLPPDVAAGRAFCAKPEGAIPQPEVGAHGGDGGHLNVIKVDRGPEDSYTISEFGGLTITSPMTDTPAKHLTLDTDSSEKKDLLDPEAPKDEGLDAMIKEVAADKKEENAGVTPPPVFAVRCPFRRVPAFDGDDARAFAVWAGLRPMSQLEVKKALVGLRDPSASYVYSPLLTNPPNTVAFLDIGLPTERYANALYYSPTHLAPRVGIRATANSDQAAAGATYWGISEISGSGSVEIQYRDFRGTHGDGAMPAGAPGASLKRKLAPFKEIPADWPNNSWQYGHRSASEARWRLVASATNRTRKTPPAPAIAEKQQPVAPPVSGQEDTRRADTIKVTNIKYEAGTNDCSTVTFDLSWDNSWRTKWMEPADKNVTGKPLEVESWDAAWVFVKFRQPGSNVFSHATLAPEAAQHVKPAGVALAVGLTDDGTKGTGVFIYRDAIGQGANDFKGVRLRWLYPPTLGSSGVTSPPSSFAKATEDKSLGSSGVTSDAAFDPAKGTLAVHAIAMVYVPEGPFLVKSPWDHPLFLINHADPTKPGGHPDWGTNSTPKLDTWPNGYSSFYIMKYSISQGEYAWLLNEHAPDPKTAHYNDWRYGAQKHSNHRRYTSALYNFCGYTIKFSSDEGRYNVDVPDRAVNFLSLVDILSFAAWSGLRPLSNLEYEKACRGPRAVARDEDAWAPGACAPAAGIPAFVGTQVRKDVLPERRPFWPCPSYWGIQDLSQSGCVQEWPLAVNNHPVYIGQYADKPKGIGTEYNGTHGSGSPEVTDITWPWSAWGEWYVEGWGQWAFQGQGYVGNWLMASEFEKSRALWDNFNCSRTGRYGARAARTAPVTDDKVSPLTFDPLPVFTGHDLAIFHLTGSFNNTGDKPLKLEVVSSLPDTCFPEGAASRQITAAPKAITPFKILTAVTRQTAAGAVRRGMFLPVRVEGRGGAVLAEEKVLLRMGAPAGGNPVIGSLAGGEVALRITNATPRAAKLGIRISPVGAIMAETSRTVTVAAGGVARAAFPIRRQAFAGEGEFRIPYTVVVSSGAPLSGETVIGLRTVSRWWITKRVKTGPKLLEGVDLSGGGGEDITAAMDSAINKDSEVLKADKPPKGWQALTSGAILQWPEGSTVPSHGSCVVAATRVEVARGAQEVILKVFQEKPVARFGVKAWFNDQLVFESHPAKGQGGKPEETAQPFRFRAAGNNLVVECMSEEDGAAAPANIMVGFSEAKGGKPMNGIVFDVDRP